MPLSRSKPDSKDYAVKTWKRHSGYRPRDYLERGDLWKFEMTEAVEWEGTRPYKVPLSKVQGKRVLRMIEEFARSGFNKKGMIADPFWVKSGRAIEQNWHGHRYNALGRFNLP